VNESTSRVPWWYALLGLARGGKILYRALFVLAVPGLVAWFVVLPRWRFTEQDERLFRAARHGDAAGIEQALTAGAHLDARSPIDGKTALFRAAIFGHTIAVRTLLAHGANALLQGSDGKSALDVANDARQQEKNPALAQDLDAVVTLLRGSEAR